MQKILETSFEMAVYSASQLIHLPTREVPWNLHNLYDKADNRINRSVLDVYVMDGQIQMYCI